MERSAGAVIFYKDKQSGAVEYLLLHYPKLSQEKKRQIPGHWDFPKGHMEKAETEIETVSREVAEETGINHVRVLPAFREEIRYIFQKEGKKVFKKVIFYVAQVQSKNVELSYEHLGFQWLAYEKALETLTYKNAKAVLQKANVFLQQKSSIT